MEQAVNGRTTRSPRLEARDALEQLTSTRCSCGSPAMEIRRAGGSVIGRCATHRESRPNTISEKKLQLALHERELRG
jgi:hypothetical protein